jgi:D-glycero-D-manno-heptose 1,7-bisphosphate phosphatase
MRPAVFLDRDGVLNRVVTRADGTTGSPRFASDFALLPGAAEAVRALRRAGLATVVVTNQPDVARAQLDWRELAHMHALLRRSMRLDAILTCTHDDRAHCACRKPRPGMLTRASRALDLSLDRSFLIGDSLKDMAAGRAAGCRTILVGDEVRRSAAAADWIAEDLPGAAALVLRSLEPDTARRLLADFERETALRACSTRRADTVLA